MVYYSSNINDIKEKLLMMKRHDELQCLWGVGGVATDATGKDRQWFAVISIYKTVNKYYFFSCDYMFEQGYDMIKEICKDLKIKKLQRLLDMNLYFDYEDLIKVINVMPKYFDKYANNDRFITYVSFDRNVVKLECDRQKRPFDIENLKKSIYNAEHAIKTVDDMKKRLVELQKAEAEDAMYRYVNSEN